MMFIYACLGVGLFGTVAHGEALNDWVNFHSFGNALMLLLRVATGDDWHELMLDVVSDRPNCTQELQSVDALKENGPNGCGEAITGYPYFITFNLLVSLILMNLIVAVVLDGFHSVQQLEIALIFDIQMEKLGSLWRRIDTGLTGYMEYTDALHMLRSIPEPVGFRKPSLQRQLATAIAKAKAGVADVSHHLSHGSGSPVNRSPQKKGDLRMVGRLSSLPLYGNRQYIHLRDVVELCAARCFLWMCREPESDVRTVPFHPTLLAKWRNQFREIPAMCVDSLGPVCVGHLAIEKFVREAWFVKRLEIQRRLANQRPGPQNNRNQEEPTYGGSANSSQNVINSNSGEPNSDSKPENSTVLPGIATRTPSSGQGPPGIATAHGEHAVVLTDRMRQRIVGAALQQQHRKVLTQPIESRGSFQLLDE